MRKTAWITGAVLTLGLATAAWAGAPGGRGRGEGLKERLGLTAEQEAQWREQRDARREAARQQREEHRKLRDDLRAALGADPVDEGKVRAIGRRLGELEAARAQARVEDGLALSKLLTPEQRDKLAQIHEQRRERRERMRERRQQRRGAPAPADGEAGER